MADGGWFSVLAGHSDVDKTPAVDNDLLIYDDAVWQWKPAQLSTIGDTRYLKLDQTTPQTVVNGAPIFDKGLRSNGAIILKSGQKLIFDGA
jgi:hypothetical protein